MTDPAAVSALAEAWLAATELPPYPESDNYLAESVLTHPFTPAQRAAIAAEILTPEVLAEALSIQRWAWLGWTDETDEGQRRMRALGNAATAIMAALRESGKEPAHG